MGSSVSDSPATSPRTELAAIFAAAILRLNQRPALKRLITDIEAGRIDCVVVYNPFTKATLHKLLTNITYLGKVRYKNEVHDGEHAAVVDPEIWKQTQAILQKNGRTGGRDVRNKFGALLRGLLRCVPQAPRRRLRIPQSSVDWPTCRTATAKAAT